LPLIINYCYLASPAAVCLVWSAACLPINMLQEGDKLPLKPDSFVSLAFGEPKLSLVIWVNQKSPSIFSCCFPVPASSRWSEHLSQPADEKEAWDGRGSARRGAQPTARRPGTLPRHAGCPEPRAHPSDGAEERTAGAGTGLSRRGLWVPGAEEPQREWEALGATAPEPRSGWTRRGAEPHAELGAEVSHRCHCPGHLVGVPRVGVWGRTSPSPPPAGSIPAHPCGRDLGRLCSTRGRGGRGSQQNPHPRAARPCGDGLMRCPGWAGEGWVPVPEEPGVPSLWPCLKRGQGSAGVPPPREAAFRSAGLRGDGWREGRGRWAFSDCSEASGGGWAPIFFLCPTAACFYYYYYFLFLSWLAPCELCRLCGRWVNWGWAGEPVAALGKGCSPELGGCSQTPPSAGGLWPGTSWQRRSWIWGTETASSPALLLGDLFSSTKRCECGGLLRKRVARQVGVTQGAGDGGGETEALGKVWLERLEMCLHGGKLKKYLNLLIGTWWLHFVPLKIFLLFPLAASCSWEVYSPREGCVLHLNAATSNSATPRGRGPCWGCPAPHAEESSAAGFTRRRPRKGFCLRPRGCRSRARVSAAGQRGPTRKGRLLWKAGCADRPQNASRVAKPQRSAGTGPAPEAINSLPAPVWAGSLLQLGKTEAQSKLNDLPRIRYVGMVWMRALPVGGNVFLSNLGFCCCCTEICLSTASAFIAPDSLQCCGIEVFVTAPSCLAMLSCSAASGCAGARRSQVRDVWLGVGRGTLLTPGNVTGRFHEAQHLAAASLAARQVPLALRCASRCAASSRAGWHTAPPDRLPRHRAARTRGFVSEPTGLVGSQQRGLFRAESDPACFETHLGCNRQMMGLVQLRSLWHQTPWCRESEGFQNRSRLPRAPPASLPGCPELGGTLPAPTWLCPRVPQPGARGLGWLQPASCAAGNCFTTRGRSPPRSGLDCLHQQGGADNIHPAATRRCPVKPRQAIPGWKISPGKKSLGGKRRQQELVRGLGTGRDGAPRRGRRARKRSPHAHGTPTSPTLLRCGGGHSPAAARGLRAVLGGRVGDEEHRWPAARPGGDRADGVRSSAPAGRPEMKQQVSDTVVLACRVESPGF